MQNPMQTCSVRAIYELFVSIWKKNPDVILLLLFLWLLDCSPVFFLFRSRISCIQMDELDVVYSSKLVRHQSHCHEELELALILICTHCEQQSSLQRFNITTNTKTHRSSSHGCRRTNTATTINSVHTHTHFFPIIPCNFSLCFKRSVYNAHHSLCSNCWRISNLFE